MDASEVKLLQFDPRTSHNFLTMSHWLWSFEESALNIILGVLSLIIMDFKKFLEYKNSI